VRDASVRLSKELRRRRESFGKREIERGCTELALDGAP
jgi:hypothetical protein